MKIALVAPLYESVPPKSYGGTERIVSYLTEALVKAGHEVTLFASGDSVTNAQLVPITSESLRLHPRYSDPIAHHVLMLDKVAAKAPAFDIVHFHIDYLHLPLMRILASPHLTTLHGRLDIPDVAPIYAEFRDSPLVSISNEQRKALPSANWLATVHHGVPKELYRFHPEPGQYLAFIGRISPEKRVDRAIEIAKRTGMPIRIAAKVDKADHVYYEQRIAPLLDHPLVEYIGEIGEAEKNAFLGDAYALLFPIDWPEPFGLVMIEALACGTPVIAYRNGSVPEVIQHGETGFVVENLADATKAVESIAKINRHRCRRVFEERFSAQRMARDYVTVYENVIEELNQPRLAV